MTRSAFLLLAALVVLLVPLEADEDDKAVAKAIEKDRRALSRTLRRRGSDYDERVEAIARVRVSKEHDRVELCAIAIRNDARPVRLIAAQTLGEIRELRVIPILVTALSKEKKVTVINAIVASLEKLTHRPLGKDPKRWKDWWRSERDTFRMPPPIEKPKPRPKRKNTGETRTVSTPRFYGIDVEATDIVFVIDKSLSMLHESARGSGTRWGAAVREVLAVVDKLPDHARVNVVLFSTDVWSWREGLTDLSARTRQQLKEDLRARSPRGGTDLFAGIARGLEEGEVEAIYVLSDGEPSSGKLQTDSAILSEVRKRNFYRRATIHVVAVGYKSSLLQKLASGNGGRYVTR